MKNLNSMLSKLFTAAFIITTFFAAQANVNSVDRVETGQKLGAGSQPEISVDSKGIIHIVYGIKNGNERALYYLSSGNGGKSYSKPVLLGNFSQMGLGMGRGPQITTTKDYTVITVGDHYGNLYAIRSSDIKTQWSAPVRINDSDTTAKEALSGMSAGRDNRVYTAWLDTRLGNNNLYGALSKDGGMTWGKNHLIYKGEQKGICDCCKPSVAIDQKGNLHVLFRNKLDGARNMYLISSKDNGEHFDKAQKLGAGNFLIDACPMDGGHLSIDASGKLTTVWRRQMEIYLAEPSEPEVKLGNGRTPVILPTINGPAIAWHQDGVIQFRSPNGEKTIALGNGQYPKLAWSPDKKSILCVYELDGEVMITSVQM